MDYSKYTVLVVDDIPLNVILVTRMLSTKFNFNIRVAYGGFETLASIEEKKPDIILLDLQMPEPATGYYVLEKVRSNKEYADIKVIILSAYNSADDIAKGYRLGTDDYITKPIIMEQLLSSVEKQIAAIEGRSE